MTAAYDRIIQVYKAGRDFVLTEEDGILLNVSVPMVLFGLTLPGQTMLI